jgi:NADPH:quinone reductase-like Zn-dependent oxidoreductase
MGISGCFRSFVRADEDTVIRIPDSLGYEIAAGLPCIYCTAIYSLLDVARLQAGENILIHAAAGGVGQAAIQIAQLTGANIFATVSSIEKRDVSSRS